MSKTLNNEIIWQEVGKNGQVKAKEWATSLKSRALSDNERKS